MKTEFYNKQLASWPKTGKHVMAQYDAESIIVYQAYRPEIAEYAIEKQEFGGAFKYDRMSWIKPNFLWMMYRSGWALKEGQEYILAVTLNRGFFDELTEQAVASSFGASGFSDHDAWKQALTSSEVRLQWDPDHSPTGEKVERKAVQLGLRGSMLRRYGKEAVLKIEDVTPFVNEQRANLTSGFENLEIAYEEVYTLTEKGRTNLKAHGC